MHWFIYGKPNRIELIDRMDGRHKGGCGGKERGKKKRKEERKEGRKVVEKEGVKILTKSHGFN